ncbi:MAG TPA: O-methyltransferase [Puia sp.]|nr:O-methyltransferase [Puia sp.]
MNKDLFLAVDDYITRLFVCEDDVLIAARGSIRNAGLEDISVSPVQGSFLRLLGRLISARNILEIGTFAGYSTIWLARSLIAPGRLITLEFDPVHAAIAKTNFERAALSDTVDLRVGRGLDLLPQLEKERSGPFDMIFIDADKPPYPEYFQWALRLSRPGTLLVFDNVIREGKVLDRDSADEKVKGVQRLNEVLAHDPRVCSTILTTVGAKDYDGMAIAVVN